MEREYAIQNNFPLAITLWPFRMNSFSQKWMKGLNRVNTKILIFLEKCILCRKWRCVKEAYTMLFSTIHRKIRNPLMKILRNC